jgi:sugar phosphate isomerase/epimerase
MKTTQVAAQTYTIREHTQTAYALSQSLRKLRNTGFRAIELSGIGPISASEIKRMMDDEGLTCCASHESEEALFGNPDTVIERMQMLGCPLAVYPWPGDRRFDSLDTVLSFARRLNETGRTLQNAGIAFAYHNHHMEFIRVRNRPALEVLFDEADPVLVKAELDTYWVQFGGGNPVNWCDRLKGRLAVLHMKDYAIHPDRQVVFAEVGSGNLEWPAIIAAADRAGCSWFVIEQDTCPGDPFASLKKSYDYVMANLARGQD